MGVVTRRRQDEIAAYCRLAKADGLTLRRALLEYRRHGGKVRTSTFVRAWRDVKAPA